MVKYYYKLRFAPDNGGGGGGGGNPSSASSGNPGHQQSQSPEDPWAKVDLDALDDDSRAALEKLKGDFATLQSRAQENERLARTHQSERDRIAAELDKTRKAVMGDAQPPKQTTAVDRVYAQLIQGGMNQQEAAAQAKLLGGILENERQVLQQQIGRDLAPVVGITLTQQADAAFRTAQQMDRIGALSNPDVAQLVWNSCAEMAQQNQQVTPEVVKNLAAMHYYNYLEKNGGNFATLQNGNNIPNNGMNNNPQPPSVPGFNTGGFSYPGANFHPTVNPPPNPNAPRTTLDAGTQAALNSVQAFWNRDLPSKNGGAR